MCGEEQEVYADMASSRPPELFRREAILSGWTNDPATARRLFAHESPAVRASAFGALVRLGAVTDAEFDAAIRDDAWQVRHRAFSELPRLWGSEPHRSPDAPGSTVLADAVLAGLSDRDDVVVELACFVAGECLPSPAGVIERLCVLATDHDEALIRESAVAALGSLGDARGRPSVLAACGDKATVRRRAVLALTAFDGDEVDEMLTRMADDVDWQVRQAAEELLAIGEVEL